MNHAERCAWVRQHLEGAEVVEVDHRSGSQRRFLGERHTHPEIWTALTADIKKAPNHLRMFIHVMFKRRFVIVLRPRCSVCELGWREHVPVGRQCLFASTDYTEIDYPPTKPKQCGGPRL